MWQEAFLHWQLTNGANAQSSNNIVSAEQFKMPLKINKSVLPAETNSAIHDASMVSAKALKDFKKSYKNAGDDKWVKSATVLLPGSILMVLTMSFTMIKKATGKLL